jgi:hypothetical protein
MPSTQIPTFEKLAITTEAVNQYCADRGISDERERQYVVQLADSLFDMGETSLKQLLAGLEAAIGPTRRQA